MRQVLMRDGIGGWKPSVQEAYLTYAATSKLSIIGGRFVTPEGFEGVDTVNNPNFSEGLLFFAAEPISHTGVKATYTFSDKVNATIGVVNGWNVDTDNNSQKTIIWQVATTPTKQTSWSFQGTYGNGVAGQPAATSDHADLLSLDTVAGYNPTDKLSLNIQGNWGEQTHDPAITTGMERLIGSEQAFGPRMRPRPSSRKSCALRCWVIRTARIVSVRTRQRPPALRA